MIKNNWKQDKRFKGKTHFDNLKSKEVVHVGKSQDIKNPYSVVIYNKKGKTRLLKNKWFKTKKEAYNLAKKYMKGGKK